MAIRSRKRGTAYPHSPDSSIFWLFFRIKLYLLHHKITILVILNANTANNQVHKNLGMLKFNTDRLRVLRKSKHMTAAELAAHMGTSPAQIHRLEKGLRRLTVDALLQYCDALGVSVAQLFSANTWVPITGVIDSDFEIQPIPADSEDKTLMPPITTEIGSTAALRWAASRRFQPMLDHIVFYQRHNKVPDVAWNKRCLVTRMDGSQCLGWPIKDNDKTHIDVGDGPAEFNVEIASASPVIAVMPPFAIQALEIPEA
jgi:repressor LexA